MVEEQDGTEKQMKKGSAERIWKKKVLRWNGAQVSKISLETYELWYGSVWLKECTIR